MGSIGKGKTSAITNAEKKTIGVTVTEGKATVDMTVNKEERESNKRSSSTANKDVVSSIQKQVQDYEEKSKSNPKNSLYKNELANNKLYLKEAKTLDMSKSSFTGVKAALYLSHAKLGDKVTISGTGIRDGNWTLKKVKSPFSGKQVSTWVRDSDNAAFATNMSTTTSELSLVRGGIVSDNKKVKVKKRK